MPTYVEIAVNVPTVTDVFHYHLPEDLQDEVNIGTLVEAPFGRQTVQGVVLRFIEQPSVAKTRPVLDVIDPQAALTEAQIRLAEHLSQTTVSPIAAWIKLMLPPGLGQQSDMFYELSGIPRLNLSDFQKKLVGLLEKRGPLRGRQIGQAFRHVDWRSSLRALVRKGMITATPVLPAPTIQPKHNRTVRLAKPPEEIEATMSGLGRQGSPAQKRRQAILRFLLQEPEAVDVAWAYAASGGNSADLRYLEGLGLVVLGESQVWRDPLEGKDLSYSQPPTLTHDQQTCWETIQGDIQDALSGQSVRPALLHGVTGSGKTEIYLHAVQETLRLGRQAIVLVPEIALTPQTVQRFLSRFPGQVGLVHSQLSGGERYDTWRRARAGILRVVVGARSALFTPFPNLGLIVVDECHDGSYYQDEPPFYHAKEIAVNYAGLVNGLCLLGSATPDVGDIYQAGQSRWRYLTLPARILAHREAVQSQVERLGLASHYRPLEAQAEFIELPLVKVVDMRNELKAGNRSIFSRALQAGLSGVLERDQQAILFLNRRGMATYVFCRDCGYTLKCPQCDIPLTYHIEKAGLSDANAGRDALICHRCGYRRKMPSKCPKCGGERIRQYGTGTERVEAELQTMFPSVRILRWDYETTRQKGAHELILNRFVSHQADVLVGTQMLAKGLDLPLVTLVGVVLADVGLHLPDYRAAERSFQVLTQVAGRAGRGPLGGEVILQTFDPDNYVIKAASNHDYQGFSTQELAYRRQLGYPPFQELARLEYRHPKPDIAESAAQKMAGRIQTWASEESRSVEMVGPLPCYYSRLAGQYRWQIVLRGRNLVTFLKSRSWDDWRVEINPPSLL